MRDKRRFAWLDALESGTSTKDLAHVTGLSIRTIQLATAEARAEVTAWVESRRLLWPPRLILFFPINGLFPHSTCRCNDASVQDAMSRGTSLCCAICHRSGQDGHPALQRYRRFEPRPDHAPQSQSRNAHGTRRQRRAKLSDQPERAPGIQAA